mgnify:CR=1 FL=1
MCIITRIPELSISTSRSGGKLTQAKGWMTKPSGTAFKAGGDIHGSILCLLVYIVGCLCEIGGEVCYEIKTDGQYNESDDERLYYISFRDGQYQREEVEHSGQRRQRQELVTRQDDSQQYGYGNQQQETTSVAGWPITNAGSYRCSGRQHL